MTERETQARQDQAPPPEDLPRDDRAHDDQARADDGQAHDVLAAEEFGVPAADPVLRHAPVTLPGDPSGIAEPHDVLAAEEFAIPGYRTAGSLGTEGGERLPRARSVAFGAAALLVVWRLLRHRRT